MINTILLVIIAVLLIGILVTFIQFFDAFVDFRQVVYGDSETIKHKLNDIEIEQKIIHKVQETIYEAIRNMGHQYISTRNRLDVIIASLDDICNVCKNISEDTHLVEVEEVENCKDLKEEKSGGGKCNDCTFVFKPYYEEPCNKCSHGYGSKFVSRRNKE